MSSDDKTVVTQSTEALERLPRPLDRRTMRAERRQSIMQQKQTDVLPVVEVSPTRSGLRQAVQLREENRRLRADLEGVCIELTRLADEYEALQEKFHSETEVIHRAYQQEIAQYQEQLGEALEERNRALDSYTGLEKRYLELYHSFESAVEEEAHKMITAATQTVELGSDQAPAFLQQVVKTVELQVRQEGDKHLVETLYLKREVQRMLGRLEQEQQKINEERQQIIILQQSIREQATLRYKTLQQRLRSRWRVISAATSIGLIMLLVILQFLLLNLFHVHLQPLVACLLLIPILICVVAALVFTGPFSMLRYMYASAPHRKKEQ